MKSSKPARPASRFSIHYLYAWVGIWDGVQSAYVFSAVCEHEDRAEQIKHADSLRQCWLSTPGYNPPPDRDMARRQGKPLPPYVPSVGDTGTATVDGKAREGRILEVHGPVLVVTHVDPRPGERRGLRWVPRAMIAAKDWKPSVADYQGFSIPL